MRAQLLRMRLDLLQANEVGVLLCEPIVKALAYGRAKAVDIEGNDAHRARSLAESAP